MNFRFVLRPKYVTYSENMEMEELFCKLCGVAIGGLTSKVMGRRLSKDGKWTEDHAVRFRRFHNYAEMKIEFADGSFHVTNGCSSCLVPTLSVEQMHELHIADMELEPYPGQERDMQRVPVQVIALRIDGGGLT